MVQVTIKCFKETLLQFLWPSTYGDDVTNQKKFPESVNTDIKPLEMQTNNDFRYTEHRKTTQAVA